ncbi:MAG: tetratricopeptide repeat protein [Pseudomonadota bacterium]
MAARRRRWPGDEDDMIERGTSRSRRSIGEWLEDEIDDEPRRRSKRGGDEKLDAITSAISMLEERLESATQNPQASRGRRRSQSGSDDLSDVIAQITNQQDALDYQFEGQNVANIQRLQNQVRDLRGVVDAATRGSTLPGLTNDIYTLQQQLQHQAGFVPYNNQQNAQPHVQQNGFAASLDAQAQSLGQRLGLPAPPPFQLPVPANTGTSIASIEALRRDVQMLRNTVKQSGESRSLQGLEAEIRSLNRKLNEAGASHTTRDIQEIKAKVEFLNRSVQDSGFSANNSFAAKQLQQLNENISRVQRPVLPDRLVEDVRRELADATRKLVPLSIHDARSLEKNIQFLAERLDSLRARSPDNARLQALEGQLGKLSSQLSQSDQLFASLQRMEASMNEMAQRVQTGAGTSGIAGLDPKSASVLRGFQKQIEDVKASADASDKRMHHALQALQDVMVKVSEKAPVQAKADTQKTSSFGQRRETAAATAAPKSAVEAARQAAAKAAEIDDETLVELEREQIEELRNKANQKKPLTPAEATRRLEETFGNATKTAKKNKAADLALNAGDRSVQNFDDFEEETSNVTPFRRVRTAATKLALAAAGIALVIGIYNMLGPILNGDQTAIASVSQQVEQATAGLDFTPPKADEAAVKTETQTASLQPTVTPQQVIANIPAFPDSITNPKLRNAAQNGDVRALYEIGTRLVDGSRGATRDAGAGAEWLKLAADRQHAPSLYRLGVLYSKGQGAKRDLNRSVTYFTQAGILGNRKALHDLATLYAAGINGEPDLKKAFPLFQKAAELNLIDSQYNLAIFYVNGFVGEQNLNEAYKWFAIAAQNGDGESAKKRDEIGSRFSGNALVKAKMAAQSFKPQAINPAANEDTIPASAWGDAPASAGADISSIPGATDGNAASGLSIDMPQQAATKKTM